MELPKNITQIGEVGRDCKIYVEDYVVSYMKQLNRAAQDKDMAVALYGKREEENGVVYYFVYGAGKLDFLQREVRHLSQAQRQEIDRLRKRYFPELTFTGYRLLDGDMIEGFHICEQDICRYISGYAQFYEKNDAMLAYMLDVRETVQPEQVNQEKYEEVKRRQEERRAASERPARSASVSEGVLNSARSRETSVRNAENIRRMPTSVNLQKMRLTAVGVFALLCLLGIATFRENEIKNKDQGVGNTSVLATSGGVQKDTLLMEDKLEQALLQENQSTEQSDEPEKESKAPDEAQQGGEPAGETVQDEKSSGESEESQPSAAQTTQDQPSNQTTPSQPSAETKPTSEPETSQAVSGAVAYVIQPGDTLIAISKRQYGTDIRVADICNLNKISNPDDIKQGQVIMLPR